MKALISELRGELVLSLAGSEVAVVTPTLAIHTCDIPEYLRRNGVKSNMIGLARDVGRGDSSDKRIRVNANKRA